MNRIKAIWWILLGRSVAFRVVAGPSTLRANGPRRLYFTESKIEGADREVGMTEREAYAAYRAGKIPRSEWSRIMSAEMTDREVGSKSHVE